MKKSLQVVVLFLLLGLSPQMFAQCSEFETEVVLVLNSDTYGAEMYWELELQGFVIASGGCEQIKPGGLRIQGGLAGCSGLYETGTHIESICIPSGLEVTFTMYDDYGDGICCSFGNGSYEILGADPPVMGGEFGNSMSHTFTPVGISERTDMAMRSITTGNADYLVEGPTKISGTFENLGTTTVNSVQVNWQIDGGNTYKQNLTGLDIAPYSFSTVNFDHLTGWSALAGEHDLKVWISKVNGFADDDASNNSVNKTLNILEQVIENDVVVEHFTQASCGPCAVRNPAFDGMLEENRFRVAPIKYHTSWPGVDPMYNENSSDPTTRVSYYGVGGVPQAFLNGSEADLAPSDAPTIVDLSQESTQFVIELDESMTMDGNGANINVKLTAKNDININNLVAHIVVTEEMVEYDTPPGTNGEQDFPQVMRKMFPDAEGTGLPAQTAGMETSFNFTYEYPDFVDPSLLRTVVFVQNNSNREVLQGYNSTGQTGTNVESNVKGGEIKGMGVTVAVQDEFCPGGNDGSITVDATQIDGVYAVLWEGITSTENTISDLTPGVYTFSVVDGDGNQEQYSVEVGLGEGPDARFDAPEEFCIEEGKVAFDILGLDNGTFMIDGEAIEGSEWNPGKSGTYTVEYTVNAGDCSNTFERQVTVVDPIDASWSTASGTLELCQSDFPLQLIPLSENGVWSTSDGSSVEMTDEGPMLSAALGSVANGVFVVTYTGCGSSVSQNITVYKEPAVTIITTPSISICASDEDAGIDLKGIPAFCSCALTFNVYDEENNLVYSGTAEDEDVFYPAKYIDNDAEGAFKFYVASVNGLCEGPTRELTINTTAAPVVNWEEVTFFEQGSSATLDATNEGATYLWSTGATTPTIEVSEPGLYSVEIMSANGCITRAETTADFTTDIEDLTKPTLLRGYPNPANQYTVIELVNITEDLQLQVRDLAGRLITTRNINSGTTQVEVKTNGLAEGTYLYQLSKDNTILSTQKIVVIH
ncbi:MAG: Omp28-related outer membrane protein [Chitinophagales bacterium]